MKKLNVEHTFRIDGDEFVVLVPNISEDEFHAMKMTLRQELIP